jgi:DnaJ like chaperone protein
VARDSDWSRSGFCHRQHSGGHAWGIVGAGAGSAPALAELGALREKLGGRPALRNDELLFVLLGRLAKSDGRVTDGHIQQARRKCARWK